MSEIKSLEIFQNAKVLGAIYGMISVVFGVFAALFALARGHLGRALLFLIGVPILYTTLSFIFVAVLCWLYNEVARRIGGIQFELNSSEPPARS